MTWGVQIVNWGVNIWRGGGTHARLCDTLRCIAVYSPVQMHVLSKRAQTLEAIGNMNEKAQKKTWLGNDWTTLCCATHLLEQMRPPPWYSVGTVIGVHLGRYHFWGGDISCKECSLAKCETVCLLPTIVSVFDFFCGSPHIYGIWRGNPEKCLLLHLLPRFPPS